VLEKQFGGAHPIKISEVTYCLITHTLVIQFKDVIVELFNLHQFGVITFYECGTMVHGV
jgi:hypothetical protein